MPDRARFNLVIQPMPARPGEPPVEVRLRKFLKALLRDLRFRCVDIRQADHPAPDGTGADQEGRPS